MCDGINNSETSIRVIIINKGSLKFTICFTFRSCVFSTTLPCFKRIAGWRPSCAYGRLPMEDDTHKQSRSTIERAVALIEQRQEQSKGQLFHADKVAEPAQVRAETNDFVPRLTAKRNDAHQDPTQHVAARPAHSVLRSRRSVWFAGIVAMVAVGISNGIGYLLGKNTQSSTPSSAALAPFASIYSQAGELHLQMDSDFEKTQFPRR